MPADHWMNWGGWQWVSLLLTAGICFYFGWDARGTKERSRRFLERTDSRDALVRLLAGMKDPRDCPSIDDEIEAFAHTISIARSIVGDLREEDTGGHPVG